LQADLPGRHDGDLRQGEHTVGQDQGQDDQQFGSDEKF
jgi:hypothetical protein